MHRRPRSDLLTLAGIVLTGLGLVVTVTPVAVGPLTRGGPVTSEGMVTATVASARPVRALAVTGYAESGTPTRVLRAALPALSTLAADGVNISADGAHLPGPDPQTSALLSAAHRAGRRAELLVGNYSATAGDFDPAAAHRLLSSPRHRRQVERRLVALAGQGWDGIHLDFESLAGADRDGLSAFVTELRNTLPGNVSLSMAVMAGRTVAEYRAGGYDLPVLAADLDRVVLMAYDQHGPTWSRPGPVGGLPWVRTALHALLTQVPAAQVDLGVAGYGYTWPAAGTGRQVSTTRARVLATHPTWDATQGEWRATLGGTGRIWWSDTRSLDVRRRLAAGLGLHGVAVWSLGLSDPITG